MVRGKMAQRNKKTLILGALACVLACTLGFALIHTRKAGQQEIDSTNVEATATAAQEGADETDDSAVDLTTSTAPVGENARDAQSSAEVPTVAQVYEEADARGFGGAEVQASFDVTGNYHDPATLDAASEEAWASYSFPYTSAQGVYWLIYVNDGNYLAVPISHGSEVLSRQLIFTEQDHITQYDGIKNEYSDFALDELTDGIVGIRVDSLDAATLDTYTFEQLEAM